MSFGQSIKHVFKNLTNFQGRARRSEYWWFYLFAFLVSLPLSFAVFIPMFATLVNLTNDSPTGELTDEQAAQFLGSMLVSYGLLFVVSLVTFFLMLAVWVRRLHDAGYSGHWMWFCLAGLSIVPWIMAFFDSQPYPNQWGPNPKGIGNQQWPAAQPGYAQPGYPQPAYPQAPAYAQPPAYIPPAPAPGYTEAPAAPPTPPPYSAAPLNPGPDVVELPPDAPPPYSKTPVEEPPATEQAPPTPASGEPTDPFAAPPRND
ncbi:DUF805 domain-containing protein [Demequina sp.]|uniref:DUF805 domain-containing protein n=1 Tax=Demequina sp. TaxID=2050685 RepID=UPI003D0A306A